MRPTFFLLLALSLLLINCQKETESFPDFELSYFPTDSGHYVIYQVDSIYYNDFDRTIDTVSLLIKEEIGGQETDNRNQPYQRLNRYYKRDSSPWQLTKVWAIQIDDNLACRIENNQRYINLSFPLKINRQWDGIPYIRRDTVISIPGGSIDIYKDWDAFEIIELDGSYSYNGQSFDSVLTILQVDKINNIERRYSLERYAKNYGLIYKEQLILDTQCNGNIANCIGIPWEQKAEKGYILNMTFLASN